MSAEEKVLQSRMGGCHCGAVRFEVLSPKALHVYRCNCSICVKKQNNHFIVPESRFKLLQGQDFLTTYTFNTHAAKHVFCRVCGVQSFYKPRSNPNGYGVVVHCLDSYATENLTFEDFDGNNWEAHFETSDISKWSNSETQ